MGKREKKRFERRVASDRKRIQYMAIVTGKTVKEILLYEKLKKWFPKSVAAKLCFAASII
jgi:hypothetical protein